MDNNNLRLASDVCNEMIENCLKNMNWHQRLIFKTKMKMDDMWTWILINIVYRKYKQK